MIYAGWILLHSTEKKKINQPAMFALKDTMHQVLPVNTPLFLVYYFGHFLCT